MLKNVVVPPKEGTELEVVVQPTVVPAAAAAAAAASASVNVSSPAVAASVDIKGLHLQLRQTVATSGTLEQVNALLKQIAAHQQGNVNAAGETSGQTALHWAVIRGESAIVAALLAAGADLTAVDKQNQTPLSLLANQIPVMAVVLPGDARLGDSCPVLPVMGMYVLDPKGGFHISTINATVGHDSELARTMRAMLGVALTNMGARELENKQRVNKDDGAHENTCRIKCYWSMNAAGKIVTYPNEAQLAERMTLSQIPDEFSSISAMPAEIRPVMEASKSATEKQFQNLAIAVEGMTQFDPGPIEQLCGANSQSGAPATPRSGF